jgi:hypothetical protein
MNFYEGGAPQGAIAGKTQFKTSMIDLGMCKSFVCKSVQGQSNLVGREAAIQDGSRLSVESERTPYYVGYMNLRRAAHDSQGESSRAERNEAGR